MKQRILFILTSLMMIVLVYSCSKGGDPIDDGGGGPHVLVPDDTTAPEIFIFTPAASQVFNNGNIINISGRITDDLGLYRGTINIVNDANGLNMLSQPYEIHGLKLYNFNINHTASVATVTNYTITVAFEDHGTNSTSKTVKVKVNP